MLGKRFDPIVDLSREFVTSAGAIHDEFDSDRNALTVQRELSSYISKLDVTR